MFCRRWVGCHSFFLCIGVSSLPAVFECLGMCLLLLLCASQSGRMYKHMCGHVYFFVQECLVCMRMFVCCQELVSVRAYVRGSACLCTFCIRIPLLKPNLVMIAGVLAHISCWVCIPFSFLWTEATSIRSLCVVPSRHGRSALTPKRTGLRLSFRSGDLLC